MDGLAHDDPMREANDCFEEFLLKRIAPNIDIRRINYSQINADDGHAALNAIFNEGIVIEDISDDDV